jgi:hypothetical protein
MEFVFDAIGRSMGLLKGAYSCICLVKGVGVVAFRDPKGIRWVPEAPGPGAARRRVVPCWAPAGDPWE